jgi:hypothetical protein
MSTWKNERSFDLTFATSLCQCLYNFVGHSRTMEISRKKCTSLLCVLNIAIIFSLMHYTEIETQLGILIIRIFINVWTVLFFKTLSLFMSVTFRVRKYGSTVYRLICSFHTFMLFYVLSKAVSSEAVSDLRTTMCVKHLCCRGTEFGLLGKVKQTERDKWES